MDILGKTILGMRIQARVMIRLWVLCVMFMGNIVVGHAGGNPKAGERIFLENCQHCHGPKGKGNGELAEYLDPPPGDLTSFPTQSRTDDELRAIILEGRPGTKMRGFEIFEDHEIIDLLAFIRSLGK